MTYFVDTNFLLRHLLQDNPEQASEVAKYIQRAESGEVVLKISSEVILEIEYVLRKVYQVPRRKIAETLLTLMKNDIFSTEKKDLFIRAIGQYIKKNIDLVDTLIFEQAREESASVLTFDKKLQYLE